VEDVSSWKINYGERGDNRKTIHSFISDREKYNHRLTIPMLAVPGRMKPDNLNDHQLLALWAADCAEHVLETFTDAEPDDDRPRAAIAAARDWVRGVLRMTDARAAAFAAHAAARDTNSESARFVARAAGHAAATAHVAAHAQHAAGYALKAASDVDNERDWQRKHLATHLRPQFFPDGRGG